MAWFQWKQSLRCVWAEVIFYDIGVDLQWYDATMVQWYSAMVQWRSDVTVIGGLL